MSFRGVYSSNMRLKRNFFAHELAHNINAQHNEGIVAPSSSISLGFTELSRKQIMGYINGDCQNTSCLRFTDVTASVGGSVSKKALPTCAEYDRRRACRSNTACDWQNHQCTDRKVEPPCSAYDRRRCRKRGKCEWNTASKVCSLAKDIEKCSTITKRSRCKKATEDCKWRKHACKHK